VCTVAQGLLFMTMFYQSMPLYLGLLELLKFEYRIVKGLPKEYKHSLGENILTLTWKLIDLFIEIQLNGSYKSPKKLYLIKSMNTHHEQLKLRIRFLSDLKLISLKQQATIHTHIVEIGKMIGSWIKNA
jgi:hypothetical protein